MRIRDVGRVELGQQTYSIYSSSHGYKSAEVVIFALPEANAIAVANSVYRAVADMSKEFPAGLKYGIHFDTTRFVREAVSKVYETLIEAGILVLIVIMLFLQNFRALLVPATTVPVTIVGAFAAMIALGFSINLMTLFALVLAIGIVVDDAIVIVENSSYYIEKGLSPKDAAIKAMSELTGPIMGITMALVSVFLPAAFLPGITGQIFRQFALVIAATAVISAINAVTLKPTQCALWLRPKGTKPPNWFNRGFDRVYEATKRPYMGVVAPDGAPSRNQCDRVFRDHSHHGLAVRGAPHRLSPHRGPGIRDPPGPSARRLIAAPGETGIGPDRGYTEEDQGHRGLGRYRRLFRFGRGKRAHGHHCLCRLRGLEQTRPRT